MSVLSTLATISGSLMALANFPQVYKIYKRKSAKDISAITYSVYILGALIWLLYGLEIKSVPVLISNIIGIIASILILTGWFLYGR
ncbi:MAG: SemiSWEET family transporter [Candidatus Nanoarchaeia archaeon]|nr:SemiSWEET family transporter [Candidatus Nanoarchaeia archaeon]MDD5588098.1 SemiSWEET family transporter [Candidatus Nanoarchaeia archaeon]